VRRELAVPLYGELGPHRQAAWDACCRHWEANGWSVVGASRWSRASSRNAAAACLAGDVLVFADADTVVPVEQLEEAVEKARLADDFVLAYTTLYRTLRNHPPLAQLLRRPSGYRTRDVSNGVVAVSRGLWEEVGGFDERFEAWGGEDRAFLFACLALRGRDEPLRVAGHAVHLWHPHDRDASRPSTRYRANVALAMRYKRACGIEARSGPLPALREPRRDLEALRALLREPGGPRSERSLPCSSAEGDQASG
jgi:hypothetical protein